MMKSAHAPRTRAVQMLGALGALMLLSACETAVPSVEVTRFHLEPPPSGAPITLTPSPAQDSLAMQYGTFESAVARELDTLGYRTQLSGKGVAKTDYVAQIAYRTTTMAAAPRRSPVSVGVGGSTGSYGSGLGLGIGFDLSGRPKGQQVIELSVRINDMRDVAAGQAGRAVWEGRAITQVRVGSPAAQPGIAAAKLAAALFKDYPGRSGETITVP